MDTILVVNAAPRASSSRCFAARTRACSAAGSRAKSTASDEAKAARQVEGGAAVDRELNPAEVPDVPAALQHAGGWLRQDHAIDPVAIGHRVVHGGPDFDGPVLVDSGVLSRLERFVPLAPLHQPNNLRRSARSGRACPPAPGRLLRHRVPPRPRPLADHFALPEALYEEGVRRYGFHGLSYEYIAQHLSASHRRSPSAGSSSRIWQRASLCALIARHSVDSTMGFTALDGLVMGTRPGQLDPGVVLYLIAERA